MLDHGVRVTEEISKHSSRPQRGRPGVSAGVMETPYRDDGDSSIRAVPGAEIWHLEKKSKQWRDLSCDLSVQTSQMQAVDDS